MKKTLQRVLATAAAVAVFSGLSTVACAGDQEAPRTITTVYVNAHTGGSLAKDVNELHARMEKEGWKFADLAIHMENGDTEGAWVTYVKP